MWAGETAVRVNLTITGTPSGVETVEIKPFDGASIYDLAGNATLGTQTTGVKALYDKVGPKVTAGSVAADNAYIDVTFSEGVYTTSGGSGALVVGDFALTFVQNGGTATGVVIAGLVKTTGGALTGGRDGGTGEPDGHGDAERSGDGGGEAL